MLTPQERTSVLKKRLDAVRPKFPKIVWVQIFVNRYPEYEEKRQHLSNVHSGRSLDEDVISKMEELAPEMKRLTNDLLFKKS